MKELVLVGAGGHAKVCIELLGAMGKHVAFCVGAKGSPQQCLGIPVLEGDEHITRLRSQGYTRIFIAIGCNQIRNRLADLAMKQGYVLENAISPRAVVSPSAKIGQGVAVMAGAVINADATVGDLSIVNTGASIDHDCIIGRAVHISPHSALAGNVQVGDSAFLGIGTTVVPEIVIGQNAVIGAGSVVLSRIPAGTTAFGVPAKHIENK